MLLSLFFLSFIRLSVGEYHCNLVQDQCNFQQDNFCDRDTDKSCLGPTSDCADCDPCSLCQQFQCQKSGNKVVLPGAMRSNPNEMCTACLQTSGCVWLDEKGICVSSSLTKRELGITLQEVSKQIEPVSTAARCPASNQCRVDTDKCLKQRDGKCNREDDDAATFDCAGKLADCVDCDPCSLVNGKTERAVTCTSCLERKYQDSNGNSSTCRWSGLHGACLSDAASAAGLEDYKWVSIASDCVTELKDLAPSETDPASIAQAWWLEDINAPAVWAKGITGKDVQIIVNDDGVHHTHVEFKNKFSTADSCKTPEPRYISKKKKFEAHGTQAAGFATAEKNSSCGIGSGYGASLAACNIMSPASMDACSLAQLDNELKRVEKGEVTIDTIQGTLHKCSADLLRQFHRNHISSNSWGLDTCRKGLRTTHEDASSNRGGRRRRNLLSSFFENLESHLYDNEEKRRQLFYYNPKGIACPFRASRIGAEEPAVCSICNENSSSTRSSLCWVNGKFANPRLTRSECSDHNGTWKKDIFDVTNCLQSIHNHCMNDSSQTLDKEACARFRSHFVTCDAGSPTMQKFLTNIYEKGTHCGRSGQGVIYVFASGNEGQSFENVNSEPTLNAIHTISVAATGRDHHKTAYSSEGTAVFIAAPGGSRYNQMISMVSANPSNPTCKDAGEGTSFAAPVVSGVVALMLEAKPSLGWRDVQHILALTAKKTDPYDPDWRTNQAGYHHSVQYGFGLIDALHAVELAKLWTKNVAKPQLIHKRKETAGFKIPDNSTIGVSDTITITKSEVTTAKATTVEHVVIRVYVKHDFIGDLQYELILPDGTTSLLNSFMYNDSKSNGSEPFEYMTLSAWGINVEGEWTLKVSDLAKGHTGEVLKWELDIHSISSTNQCYDHSSSPVCSNDCNDVNDCHNVTCPDGKQCVDVGDFYQCVASSASAPSSSCPYNEVKDAKKAITTSGVCISDVKAFIKDENVKKLITLEIDEKRSKAHPEPCLGYVSQFGPAEVIIEFTKPVLKNTLIDVHHFSLHKYKGVYPAGQYKSLSIVQVVVDNGKVHLRASSPLLGSKLVVRYKPKSNAAVYTTLTDGLLNKVDSFQMEVHGSDATGRYPFPFNSFNYCGEDNDFNGLLKTVNKDETFGNTCMATFSDEFKRTKANFWITWGCPKANPKKEDMIIYMNIAVLTVGLLGLLSAFCARHHVKQCSIGRCTTVTLCILGFLVTIALNLMYTIRELRMPHMADREILLPVEYEEDVSHAENDMNDMYVGGKEGTLGNEDLSYTTSIEEEYDAEPYLTYHYAAGSTILSIVVMLLNFFIFMCIDHHRPHCGCCCKCCKPSDVDSISPDDVVIEGDFTKQTIHPYPVQHTVSLSPKKKHHSHHGKDGDSTIQI
eukprot:g948.t1